MTDASRDPGELAWDPAQYDRFGDERLRPARELLARVQHHTPRRVVELGCGTGEIARLMAERWPAAEVIGSDLSPEMLAKASAVPSRVRWERVDAAAWRPDEPVDVIFANAVLHWIDRHEELFPRLIEGLAPGGVLAVQMPLSFDLPSHRLMREVLASGGPGGAPLGGTDLRARMDRRPVAGPESYHALLAPLVARLDLWETAYFQTLHGADAVLEWVRGTGLRPVLAGLPEAELGRFLEEYRARLRAAYPTDSRGRTLYRFPRLFLVAEREGRSPAS